MPIVPFRSSVSPAVVSNPSNRCSEKEKNRDIVRAEPRCETENKEEEKGKREKKGTTRLLYPLGEKCAARHGTVGARVLCSMVIARQTHNTVTARYLDTTVTSQQPYYTAL